MSWGLIMAPSPSPGVVSLSDPVNDSPLDPPTHRRVPLPDPGSFKEALDCLIKA